MAGAVIIHTGRMTPVNRVIGTKGNNSRRMRYKTNREARAKLCTALARSSHVYTTLLFSKPPRSTQPGRPLRGRRNFLLDPINSSKHWRKI